MLVAFGDDLEQQLRGLFISDCSGKRDSAEFTLYPKYLGFSVASIPFDYSESHAARAHPVATPRLILLGTGKGKRFFL